MNIKLLNKYIKKYLEEITTTANVAGYNTPNAFSTDMTQQKKRAKKQGYKVLDDLTGNKKSDLKPRKTKKPEKIMNVPSNVIGTIDIEKLTEANYKEFKSDDKLSTKKKINQAVSKINGDLFRLDRMVNQIYKLKTETEFSSEKYWASTKNNLNKAQDKLTKLLIKMKKI